MAKAYYGFADCSTLHCPRTDDPSLSPTVSKSQLLQDASGHYWCNLCARRCELMNWAQKHEWLEVRVQGKMRYAIASDAENWFMSVMSASLDMIDALYETLIEQKRAPLSPVTNDDENVKRVAEWLETAEE